MLPHIYYDPKNYIKKDQLKIEKRLIFDLRYAKGLLLLKRSNHLFFVISWIASFAKRFLSIEK